VGNGKSRVAVILLTYNTLSKLKGKFVKLTIESILRQDYPNLTLIVVDNNSRDGTIDHIRKLLSRRSHIDFRIVRLPRNYGYIGGNNRGAVYSIFHGAELLFFMNDDVILLDRDLISVLSKRLEEQEDLGAVQPLIINRDGSLNCGFKVGLSSIPKMSSDGEGIFYVSGAALLTRARTFLEAGMFDQDFFIYHDDVDYAWRLRLMGYRVECVKNVRAYHVGSATLGAESSKFYYFMLRNAVWSIAKNSSMSMLIPRLTLLFFEDFISFTLHQIIVRRNPASAKACILGLVDGVKGLSTAISKRLLVQKVRKASEKRINNAMDARVDAELLFPKTLRRIFAKGKRVEKSWALRSLS
jgi:GT2 family glycosyltransferase